MTTETISERQASWEEGAKQNFRSNFNKLVSIDSQLADLNKAERAADEMFGYNYGYKSPNYVRWADRDPKYMDIVKPLHSAKDVLYEQQLEYLYPVEYVLTILPAEARMELFNLVDRYLTPTED